ncbi:MAG: mitofilin family membrane protein [Geminicoccaceae bacterium]
MARNRGKRPSGASGSTTRSQSRTADDAQTQASASAPTSSKVADTEQPDGDQDTPKAPNAASQMTAATTDPPVVSTGKTTDKAEATRPVAKRSEPGKKTTSSSVPGVQAGHKTATPTTGTSGVGGPAGSGSTSVGGPSGTGAKGSGGFWPGLIGGAIGGAATALAASLFLAGDGNDGAMAALESRLASAEEQAGQMTALGERMAAVEALPDGELAVRLGDLETKLAALAETASAEAAAGDANEGLGDRLTSLEQEIEKLAGNVRTAGQTQAASRKALEGLEGTLPMLEETLAATGRTVEEAGERTNALGQSVDTLNADVQTLATRVGAAEGRLDHLGGEYHRGAAMIVAIGDVDRAITKAEPFDNSLQSLKSLLRDDAVLGETLSVLEPMAVDGVPALVELKREFGQMASRVLLAEEGDRSITDQVSDNVFGIFKMRPAGAEAEGIGSRAVLSRAQANLSNDDLDGAIAELSDLEGAASEAASAWVERAKGRLSAEAAVVDLRTHAQGLVAKGS